MMLVWSGYNFTIVSWWCLIGQGVIPWNSMWDPMVVPHWSRRNSTLVAWWCLIGQNI